MFKTKLLILLLASLAIISCTKENIEIKSKKFSIAYISGGYDGLLLDNYLRSNLISLNKYDKNSIYEVKANISHGSNVYITNIDNTSDRSKIDTELSVTIRNLKEECETYSENFHTTQFYIYSSAEKFLSNEKASKKIKKNNTENLVRKFISKIDQVKINCNEDQSN